MKRKTRETATRSIMSAILSSDLQSQEIRALCEAILSHDPFMTEVAESILQTMQNPYLIGGDSTQNEYNHMVEDVMHKINMYGISKEEILDKLEMYDPGLIQKFRENKRLSLKRLLNEFLARAPSEVWNHFSNSLEPDPYFNHINSRI